MSRWFRHYAGMMRDDKLVRVALRSKQTVERVTWVWGAILESAAEIDDGGRYEVDVGEIAYFLRADEADIQRVMECLEELGRVHGGSVAKWGDRQFQSDKSAERQKRYRDKRASRSDDEVPSRNEQVTVASRHGDAPEAETETELDTTTVSNEPVVVRAKARPEHAQILESLTEVLSEDRAKAVIEHRKKKKSPLNAHIAQLLAKQFAQFAEPDKAADLMMMRGWQGCEVEWCVNAGLQLASSPSPATPAEGGRVFVNQDSEAWWAWRDYRKATGKPTATAVTSKEHKADGWWFPSEFPPGHVPSPSEQFDAYEAGRAA